MTNQGPHQLTFEEYEEQVRKMLDEQGLPRNWQPHKSSIEVDHFNGISVEEAVKFHSRDVERYNFLNRRRVTSEECSLAEDLYT